MKRRNFISKSFVAGALFPFAYNSFGMSNEKNDFTENPFATDEEIIIERVVEGRPHAGKVLAVIQPHNDDIPLFAGGTLAKLIAEGYTGYLIRTTNDEAAGRGDTMGERVLNNEKDNEDLVKVFGLKKAYNLDYRNHRMDENNIQEIKGRLIFLFRLLKVDTLICYDPWGQYEENPDHYITAKAVEAARWMAGMSTDYPEQLEVVQPHTVKEMYYFARGPQIANRIVDISRFIDKKVESIIACKTQGPGGDHGAQLRRKLDEKGSKLSLLGDSDETANFNYVKEFVLDIDSQYLRGVPSDKKTGEKYGLDWAEQFHYIGPTTSAIDGYIQKNAIPKK
ncbi:MAG TPA: PIG-L family deacetylase [Draconibacterium sp.]|nr:PIG-L family deacetylase [Draconibacterium sp.]